jgi:glycine hydroxymethyltransferase
MSDFLFRGSLQELDPDVYELNQIEAERQYRRLILIPSESTSPIAVREALGCAFHNIYAEGYPDEVTRWMSEEEILDYDASLARYRRYSDPRYYKGTEYADIVESLARRRCAETFAANGISADDLYVNVQALSGGPANNAVYHALVEPGDTVMGLDLLHGGHLSHGSRVNRSGKYYNIVHYSVDPDSERIDYEAVQVLAREHKPKMIIGGYSSYPWKADWAALRAIADSVGAYLFSDIAHIAGLVAAGEYPSPVGYAHVITSTTHKTLCGPRGAIIMTTDSALAKKIDRAVFPGEQGGPHVNVFSALALTFKLAQTKEFKQLQRQIIKNCIAFTDHLQARGFRIPFGGTNTHLMNLDTKSVTASDGTPLSGDMAARILDLAGIVVNRNTIPGDKSALSPSGIRMGTPWITQRGFKEKETLQLADIIADVLNATTPYRHRSRQVRNLRAKVDFEALTNAKLRVRDLAINAGIDFDSERHHYPHFYYRDDKPAQDAEGVAFHLTGDRIRSFLNNTFTSDIEAIAPGESQPTRLHIDNQQVDGVMTCVTLNEYRLSIPGDKAGLAAEWLRALSDGYIQIDDDPEPKSPGPISVRESSEAAITSSKGDPISGTKPYYVGIEKGSGKHLPPFEFEQPDSDQLKQTPLNKTHRKLSAKMIPFAGWDMPLRYTTVAEEHRAVRQAAGLFDVTHMGVYQAEGPDAVAFLDSVCANYISSLRVGKSTYSHFLDPDANVIDDLFVYRVATEKYLLVVNASNDDKDWAWLNAVKEGNVLVDNSRPWSRSFGRSVTLRNLRAPATEKEMRVDIALQGPRSREILLQLKSTPEDNKRIKKLARNDNCEVTLAGFNLIVARTGYTGEKVGFELFVHPDNSVALWDALMKAGAPLGIMPCGLAARDSLRVEAGLPLYGNEMGGELNLGVSDAGFRKYVKTYKPWFIGRQGFLDKEENRTSQVVRFRFDEKRVRVAHYGDPVVDAEDRSIGVVTSCALDSDGYLTGQAFLELHYIKKDTPIYIFQGASIKAGEPASKPKSGGKKTDPSPAKVITRFPK